MSDYIKREDAIKAMARGIGIPYTDFIDVAERCMDDIPTTDAVEVVRCKDCKKQNVHAGYKEDCCPLFEWRGISYGHEHDFQFCCYGERADK